MALKTINFEDGKYTLLHDEGHGGLTVLRYDEVWRNETGDGLILAMFHEIERLRERNSKLESKIGGAKGEGGNENPI